ncbi:Transposase [Desulfatibacillum aliphaticivorans]|nr:IS66 family transposase [Desulfatibacillum aliphaticivorans]ACL02848.1 Transposase [Desulfatibacillum aliphaticivorans]ACL04682.1 Transposase [Desulfatibacillum aliphaticivorans]ACL04683.1 Transposase [Desulfatibacillum aliphaticivorans]ACL05350.1 Transposase [Desulfatibacillum aliphaticivorans]ACL05431.1 Transposase [Desulfatibacillum aliphaticivorans]
MSSKSGIPPEDPDSLHKIIGSLQQENSSQQQQISWLQMENDRLQDLVSLFQKQIYAPKSEVRHAPVPGQMSLFEPDKEPEPIQEEEKIQVPAHARKKRGRKPLPPDLPRVEVVHDIPEEEKVCACGAQLSRIGEEVCEKLDYVPAKIRVERHIRPKYACKCCEGVEDDGPTVKIAPPAPQLIPKSLASEGLLAHVAASKFADGLPLYRQQKILARLDVDLPRNTLSNWMVKAAEACRPVLEVLKERIRSGPLINVDESPLQVLKEPGRKNTTTSYMWVFRGGPLDRPAVLYRYNPTRSGKIPLGMLKDYAGYVQSDGLSSYEQLGDYADIVRLGCMIHVRRKFMDVDKTRKKTRGGKGAAKGLANEALDFIGELYQVEKLARREKLNFDQIRELRQEKAKPILDRFGVWLKAHENAAPAKSLLNNAIQYALNQWKYLGVYLEQGYLKPDNNAAENAIRPFVVGRKNWLFAGSPRGAEASALFFSLIETAKANGLEPFAYLKVLFERIPLATCREDYLALLPTPDFNLSNN